MPETVTLPGETLSDIRLSYATCSINSPTDSLPQKLETIRQAGFNGVEVCFPDLVQYGSQLVGREVASDDYAELVTIARETRRCCVENKLEIVMLQALSHFEGWPRDSPERKEAFTKAHGWFEIMDALGTDLLQVGSTDIPRHRLSSDKGRFVEDLRELCDHLARRHKRLAYENWCWSTHAPTWRDAWRIVDAVNRPNIGLCLDTFQIAGSEWADPSTSTGRIGDASIEDLNCRFGRSMDELASIVPKEKIYLLQISDAYKPRTQISGSPEEGRWARAQWSHSFRPIPYDGGYLPIYQVVKTVLRTGYRGWLSMETFDRGPEGKGFRHEMNEQARKAMQSVQRLLRESI